MEDALITLLATLGFPVMRQGSLPDNQAYPDTFITFWNRAENGLSFYDNETASVVHDFDVNVYSSDPDTAYSTLSAARTLLRANGWTIGIRGYDAASDEITHIGRGMRVWYRQIDPDAPLSH